MNTIQKKYAAQWNEPRAAKDHVQYNRFTHNVFTYTAAALFGVCLYLEGLREDSMIYNVLLQTSQSLVRLGDEGPFSTLAAVYRESQVSLPDSLTLRNVLSVLFAVLLILAQLRIAYACFVWLSERRNASAEQQEADEAAESGKPLPEEAKPAKEQPQHGHQVMKPRERTFLTQ